MLRPIPDPCHEARAVQVIYDDLHALVKWASDAPSPEDVADDLVSYQRWLGTCPVEGYDGCALNDVRAYYAGTLPK